MSDAPTQRAHYSTAVSALGLLCFALATAALAIPLWGYYQNPEVGPSAERGYFGPWTTCKYLLYDRKKCGDGVTRFKPVAAVYFAGLVSAAGVVILAAFCVLSVVQLAMVISKEQVLCPYSFVVITKLSLALMSTLISIVAATLFALQTDDKENDFIVTRGEAFYIEVAVIIITFFLFIATIYDFLFSRRHGGDPTMSSRDPTGENATTFNNPGYKERKGVSMTDASGKPYLRGGSNGSMATLSTTVSSNGSTTGSIARSPLRSSLKKPRSTGQQGNNGIGIHNPGFSGSSPTPSRNGSVKRVRIQTNSTAV
ncbi:uncharacterized protein LOC106669796 [Cimex lectularius]|uniref:Uncharacterized protein n=1 Tax=Cimex lectularius TaxID=79782 RepID=A0A8I6S868_CIMLE|nr:uncharacterized protein LOC106669796 [Cimex lectularius]